MSGLTFHIYLKDISLSPLNLTLEVGKTQKFTALMRGFKDGHTEKTGFSWSVEGGIGTISSEGVFKATQPGAGKVCASKGKCKDCAEVTVSCPKGTVWNPETGKCEKCNVKALYIDATNPSTTKVVYKTLSNLSYAIFTAIGTPQTKTNITEGEFYFTFNQYDLEVGKNNIKLETPCGEINITAIRKEIRGPLVQELARALVPIGPEGAGWIDIIHQLFEIYHKISYSISTKKGSKTIWVGESLVNIKTHESIELPSAISAWNEIHKYRNNDGEFLEQYMRDVTEPTIPPQTDWFKSKQSSNNEFFSPGNNLIGLAGIEMIRFKDIGVDYIAPLIVINKWIDKSIN